MSIARALAWREEVRPELRSVEGPALDASTTVFRAFNGFVEGDPSLVLEVFGRCLVIHDHSDLPDGDAVKARAASDEVRARWRWIDTVVWKARRAEEPALRNGRLLRGERATLPAEVREDGVCFAVDLLLNRDASLYCDTASLRAWLRRESAGRSVLNAFAYTGALGVAARAGGASRVVQADRSAKFLALAKRSFALNGWGEIDRRDLVVDDLFRVIGRMKSQSLLFDTIVVDPPFFSQSSAGTVDLVAEPLRMLDKVQPLAAHGGAIVLVNNALFLSGAQWMDALRARCEKGYLSIRTAIDVDAWSLGRVVDRGQKSAWPSDPAPFVHPTKIVVLDVRRKDERPANVR
ncbi:MAG: class I SAM-dependent methyltransferase [Myxococcales bacterium]|nr:class I SAM-dependent methyltransferase [Myxococcales bacterium]